MAEMKFGGANHLAPLISFDTIFDLDIGLIQLIYSEFLDPKIFHIDFFQRNLIDIIKDIYDRSDKNPLYICSNPNIDHSLLDEYYNQFMKDYKSEIVYNSVSTSVLEMVKLFNKSNDITPTILCKDEIEAEMFDNEYDFPNSKIVLLNKLSMNDRKSYNQYYFKYVEDVASFSTFKAKTYYFSTIRLNLNEDKSDLKESDYIDEIILRGNNINIFNLYDFRKGEN